MIRYKKLLRFSPKQCFLLTGLILLEFIFSAWLYKTLKTREEQIHFYIFESQAKEIVASIQKEISVDLEKITSLGALYDVAYPISRENFSAFTRRLIRPDDGIQALSWIPRINGEEKNIFETRTRNTGLTSFNITEKVGDKLLPVRPRKQYFPVYFIEPLTGNETAFGFDLASSPVRLKAMKKADSTNQMILTEPINLVQGNSSEKGVLAFYPFKKNGTLIGYFSGVFKIDDLITKSSSSVLGNDFNLNAYDLGADKNNRILARVSSTDYDNTRNDPGKNKSNKINFQQVIKVADRDWLLEIIPDENYMDLKSNNYWLILLLCIAISIGISYHVISHFRSENLLLNILPAEVARELKEKGKTEARDFDMVSILFTDFTDFTKISGNLSAHELVAEINVCFVAFDEIVDKYGLEKIKTIGDAYMAVGGLPVQKKDSAKNTVLAALEMQEFMHKRKKTNDAEGKPVFKMRAGIHTGEVAAGIVGIKKFQYDIWGDAVNTASRMESRGRVCRVNISQTTHELLANDPDFSFEYRGKVEAKGKGEIEMWLVSLNNKELKKEKRMALRKKTVKKAAEGILHE